MARIAHSANSRPPTRRNAPPPEYHAETWQDWLERQNRPTKDRRREIADAPQNESRPKAAPEVHAGGLNSSQGTADIRGLVRSRPAVLSYGTSEAAAARQTPAKVDIVKAAIVAIIAAYGPLSDEQISDQYEAWRFLHPNVPDVSESSLRTRRATAVHQGLVRDSGRRGTTKRGSSCVLWEVVERGGEA